MLDAVARRDEALRAFKLGILSLGERAEVDLLFEATCGKVHPDSVLLTLQYNLHLQPALSWTRPLLPCKPAHIAIDP